MPAVQSTRVVQEMEAAILSGAFKPRERLIEMDLISRFGVSRTVIREALKRLEAKGLIRMTPYRGAVVADLTVEEIEEIYFARMEIEKIAAQLVLENIHPGEIQGLKAFAGRGRASSPEDASDDREGFRVPPDDFRPAGTAISAISSTSSDQGPYRPIQRLVLAPADRAIDPGAPGDDPGD